MTEYANRPPQLGPYAELHAHSAYSFLDGASNPASLVAEAIRCGLSALALTDHDGLYGVVQLAQAARNTTLGTVFGAELTLPRESEPTGGRGADEEHLLVLARGQHGYARLSSAIAMGQLAGGSKGQPRYDIEDLGAQARGEWLILTGCRKGALRRALDPQGTAMGMDLAAGRAEIDRLVALFGRDNVAVEITDQQDPRDAVRCAALAELAEDARLPLVATGNVHYARPADADLAAVLATVRARRDLDAMDGWLAAAPTAHLHTPAEMYVRHRNRPQAVVTADRLAQECSFDLRLVAPHLPPHPVPPGYTEATWLRELTMRGAERRYGAVSEERVAGAYSQIEHELEIITSLNFPGYFLIVHDIMEFCHRRGILAQGRGSAANSAVCYALGITAVDAVYHKLLFERFLAPERDGPPDIDIDIESGRREEVIQYVYGKFGRTHAAQVANVISYRPRSAVRDAARAWGYEPGQQNAWSKRIERWGTLRQGKVVVKPWGTVHAQEQIAQDDLTGIPEPVLTMAERMMRLPRHLGIHSGGMVMCDRPVIEVCPVEWARTPGRTVLQWDKDDCAEAGLVKFDLLGLGMLTALRLAFEEIARHGQGVVDLYSIPQDDPLVYDLLCAADTVGVFQVESRAQMATLPRLQPRTFYDIVVEVALIRPGPIQGGSVHPYITRRKQRRSGTLDEDSLYLHHLLRPALEKTLGVPLFQEQLMQMAVDAAGFTAVEADQLRRAMGSKRSAERMVQLRRRLLEGMVAKGIEPKIAEEIYEKLSAFADFGFPESHAFSFAYLVYASAWLKVHHPAAFYAALLAAQPMGFYSPQSLVADARRHGIVTLRPDVQLSKVEACVERQADGTFAVRLGLAQIRALGGTVAQRLVAEREKAGEFADLTDVVRRVSLTTTHLESLAAAEALVSFGIDRRQGLWAAGPLSMESMQTLPGVAAGISVPTLPTMSDVEVAVTDVWATAVTPTSFPTEFVRPGLHADGVLTVAEVIAHEAERRVVVAGVVTHRQRPSTAKGVTFVSLEDETGLLNVVCSAGVWTRFRAIARGSAALVIRGRVERADGATNLIAEHLSPLPLTVATSSRDFR